MQAQTMNLNEQEEFVFLICTDHIIALSYNTHSYTYLYPDIDIKSHLSGKYDLFQQVTNDYKLETCPLLIDGTCLTPSVFNCCIEIQYSKK